MNCVEENYIKLKPVGQRFSSTAAAAVAIVIRNPTMNLDLINFLEVVCMSRGQVSAKTSVRI